LDSSEKQLIKRTGGYHEHIEEVAMYRKKALITGGSSGIGACFAKKAASIGYDVILIARNKRNLEKIADEISLQYHVSVETIIADLTDETNVENLTKIVNHIDNLGLLVNNAGFAVPQNFAESDIEKQLDMVRVHINAHLKLTRAALPMMLKNKDGAIINVCSTLAFIPFKENSVYCASKAFLNVFSEVLQKEVQGTGLQVQALNPGGTNTNFHQTDAFAGRSRSRKTEAYYMNPEEVVEYAFRKLGKQLIVIPGMPNRLMVVFKNITSRILDKMVKSRSN
jgi:short-subunit dehydrogenase